MSVIVTYWDEKNQHRSKTFTNANSYGTHEGLLILWGPKPDIPNDGVNEVGIRQVATYAPSTWFSVRIRDEVVK